MFKASRFSMYTFFVALFDAVKAGERKIEGKRVWFDLVETIIMTSYKASV